MSEMALLGKLLATETGLATVTTVRAGGRPLSSVVNAGLLSHPDDGSKVVAFVAAGAAAKLGHLRRNPAVNVLARRGWQWAAVDGDAELIGPDDPRAGFDADRVRLLLRQVFEAAGGTHDDFDEFDRAMRDERRCAVLVRPRRVYSNPS